MARPMLASSRTRRTRRIAACAAAAGLAASAVTAAGTTAAEATAAAPTIRVNYPVTGTTFIKATNSSLELGPGTLESTLDLGTGNLSAHLKMPPANGSFKQLGIIPVTVTTELIEEGPTTGTIDPATGAVRSTSKVTLQLKNLKVAGIPIPVGDSCKTKTPATINLASEPDWNVLTGGTLSGSYTIPEFENCLLATLLINITVPGPDNTIKLKLGKGTVPAA